MYIQLDCKDICQQINYIIGDYEYEKSQAILLINNYEIIEKIVNQLKYNWEKLEEELRTNKISKDRYDLYSLIAFKPAQLYKLNNLFDKINLCIEYTTREISVNYIELKEFDTAIKQGIRLIENMHDLNTRIQLENEKAA